MLASQRPLWALLGLIRYLLLLLLLLTGLDLFHGIFKFLHRFVSLELRFALFVLNSFQVNLELVDEAITNVRLLPHLHVHHCKFIFFYSRQFLSICSFGFLFD